jgi:hypothetical protein
MEAYQRYYYLVYDFMGLGDLEKALATGQGLSERDRVKVRSAASARGSLRGN